MPDPTKGSPLAGIEQMLRDTVAEYGNTYNTTGENRVALWSRDAADYLAGLGKVLEECPEISAADDPEKLRVGTGTYYRLRRQASVAFVQRLYTYLSTPTSPREPRGKEKE